MLQVAQELCHHVLPAIESNPSIDILLKTGAFTDKTALVETNGDAQLWQRLCSLNNRAVVRVPFAGGPWTEKTNGTTLTLHSQSSLYWADSYPPDAPVLDHRGQVVMGIHPDNLMPLCLHIPEAPAQATLAREFLLANPLPNGKTIPACPAQLFEKDADGAEKWLFKVRKNDSGSDQLLDADLWASRGAINAGFAVFLYLEQITKGTIKPKPSYNQCEQLPKSSM
jgi:hypothetical protein